MPLDALIHSQAAWARSKWPGHSAKRAPSLEANLIIPLDAESRKEFAAGSGGELGTQGKPGNMSSLRSSSALCFNVFGPWRGQPFAPLTAALRGSVNTPSLRFEQKFRHGLRGTPPNLDVALGLEDSRPVGIECKFTEPYGPKHDHPALDPKYFAGGRARWAERWVQLPRCQKLVESVGNGMPFKRLGVGQLLKHLLGLAHTTKAAPRLRYVWFDSKCDEAREHREELARFTAAIDQDVDFVAMTYQDLLAELRRSPEPEPGYFAYLDRRYFA